MTLSKEIKKTNELLDLLLQTIKRTNKIIISVNVVNICTLIVILWFLLK